MKMIIDHVVLNDIYHANIRHCITVLLVSTVFTNIDENMQSTNHEQTWLWYP